MAAQRATHVPRFGNWDANDHAPYTKVFETARAGRGGKLINPNDPAQNPEAFAAPPPQRQPPQQAINNHTSDPPRRPAPRAKNSNSREDGEFRRYMETPSPARIGKNSGSSFSDRRNGSAESPYHHRSSAAPPAPKVDKISSQSSFPSIDHAPLLPQVAALPKFGDWDVKDPSSAEGFTMIFNNARNERQQQGAPGRSPQLNSAEQRLHQQNQHNYQQQQKRSSWFCCFS